MSYPLQLFAKCVPEKYFIYVPVFLIGLYSCTGRKNMANPSQEHNQPAGSRSLIIYYDTKTGNGPLLKAIKENKAEILYIYKNMNAAAIKINSHQTAEEAIRYYEKVQGVLHVTQDQKMELYKTARPD